VGAQRGAPTGSVSIDAVAEKLDRGPDDLSLLRAVELLEQDGWVEADYEMGRDGPLSARPLPKALAGTRGSPGGDDQANAERLVAALDELAAREPSEERRSKLSQVRQFLLELGPPTIAEVVAKLGAGAL
jgi:hypothetical protein